MNIADYTLYSRIQGGDFTRGDGTGGKVGYPAIYLGSKTLIYLHARPVYLR